MESVGEKLKSAREARNCNLDQAARDTHISKRFLEALEEESFSSLPGDSYVVGFLRSYADYLGLDSVEMVNLYRNLKLQEQPAPLSELIVRTGLPMGVKISIIIALAAVVIVGALLLLNSKNGSPEARVVEVENKVTEGAYVMSSPAVVNKFAVDQVISVPLDGQNFDISFSYKNDQIKLNLKDGQVVVTKGQDNELDLNSDGKMDLKVLVNDVDTKANPVQLSVALNLLLDAPQSMTIKSAFTGGSGEPGYGMTKVAARLKKPVAFPEYPAEGAIACSIIFDMPMVFRYEDDNGHRVERTSSAGETIEVSAQKRLRMWFANGGMVSLAIGSRTIRAGSEGEIVAWELSRLSPDLPGQLALIPLY